MKTANLLRPLKKIPAFKRVSSSSCKSRRRGKTVRLRRITAPVRSSRPTPVPSPRATGQAGQAGIFCLILIILSSGCAHKGDTQSCKPISSPAQAAASTPSVQSRERGGADDFFEDEFSTNPCLVADPLAPINRVVFQFNDKLYFWCLKPIARGYRFVVPEPIRLGIGNLFYNVAGIGRMANCLFQGKFRSAGAEIGRFFVNSTAGLLGLGNPAANYPALNLEMEDMGQTLGTYGIDNGFYLVLPILGPSTLRDAIGMVGDWLFYPISYLRPWYVPTGVRAVDLTNKLSFHIGDYETVKDSALDPYLMFRSAYIQTRQQMVER